MAFGRIVPPSSCYKDSASLVEINIEVELKPKEQLKYKYDRTLKAEYESHSSGSKVVYWKGADMKQTENTIKTQKTIKSNPYQRGKTWTYIVYPKDPITGKTKQKWVGGFPTKKEAEAAKRKAEAEILAGTYKNHSHLTLNEYLQQWFKTHSKAIEPGTAQGYWNNIELHILPHIGKVKLRDLDRHKLTAFYFMLQERGKLSASTIRYIHATLRKALNDAVKDELIYKNPCNDAVRPKSEPHHSVVLNKAQAQVLVAGALNTEIEMEVILAATTGARRGEVLGLRFQDVDFENNSIHIVQQVSTIRRPGMAGGQWGIKTLKTNESNRIVAVPNFVMEHIKARKVMVYNQKLENPDYKDNDLICCNKDGTIKSPQTVYHQYKKLLTKLGLPDIRFHDLRHTCASLLLEQKVDLAVISKALGHSTIKTTADIYIDTMGIRHQTAEAMEELLRPKNK